MLNELKKHFCVCILNEVHGEDLKSAIETARIVINLHYYNNALLEVTRIYECLSLGVPVVSENTQDQNDYPELKDVVKFFETGSVSAMLQTVEEALKNPVSEEKINKAVERGINV